MRMKQQQQRDDSRGRHEKPGASEASGALCEPLAVNPFLLTYSQVVALGNSFYRKLRTSQRWHKRQVACRVTSENQMSDSCCQWLFRSNGPRPLGSTHVPCPNAATTPGGPLRNRGGGAHCVPRVPTTSKKDRTISRALRLQPIAAVPDRLVAVPKDHSSRSSAFLAKLNCSAGASLK